jgi:hypothetical protein
MTRIWILVAAAAAVFGVWQFTADREIPHPPGILAAAEPKQASIPGAPPVFTRAAYKITALASFDITARVIRAEHYHFDRESDLAPVDLALGWGPMSDTAVLHGLSFSQDHRFYFYHWDHAPPIPAGEIVTHSANMHLIPANGGVAKRLSRIRAGNLVHFTGYLVKVDAPDGWHWVSSLTRTDTGGGACELVWVEDLDAS